MIDEEITKAFGDDSVSFEQSSKEKRLLIGTQISSMALQLHITTRQLCQSYAYQTTRFYQQCVVGSIGSKGVGGNPLDALCGGFLDGTAYFRPFQKDPDDSIDEFVDYAKTYMEGLETHVKVRFAGWDASFDEWLPIGKGRVCRPSLGAESQSIRTHRNPQETIGNQRIA